MKSASFFIAGLCLLCTSCIRPQPVGEWKGSTPYFIQYRDVQLVILPDLGGTVVMLSDRSGENIFRSDRPKWYTKAEDMPSMSPYREPLPVNGHTVWLGPQSDWWVQQSVDARMRRKAPAWPPDPYLTMGRYAIKERTDSSVTLVSSESPYSGIRMEKKIAVLGKGKVSVHVIATNVRSKPVRWDIWQNSRLKGDAVCYVPVSGISGIKKISSPRGQQPSPLFYTIIDGLFTFPEPYFPENSSDISTKAFLIPDAPSIAAFTGNMLFIKKFPSYPDSLIHPEQAPVEIYLRRSSDKEKDILELEHHSPYRILQPGESMEDYEEWEIHPYEGPKNVQDQIAFLKKMNF